MLTIGDYNVDETKFAPVVTQRLLQRQVAHILNNEASSFVLAKTKRAIVGKDGKPDSVTDEQLEAYRAAHAVEIDAWTDEYRQGKIAAMHDGTLSVRVARGPSRDPVESASRTIAKAEVAGVLKNHGAKFPGKDETVSIGDQDLDGDTLIDRRLAHAEHGPRIRKLAERKVADDKRLREATAKASVGETGGLAASLGL